MTNFIEGNGNKILVESSVREGITNSAGKLNTTKTQLV